ncbi:hypothetical protein EF834_01390 [Rhodococcus spongiicola]|uniref:Uncharacterized protein n=1 Tax=Rhodococcus spongiicola TaxID=2487352 RepID=A0A438B569_9NOCA|nr:hypothetical protein EF834_01390 [Rhodococcus spongiicola]
MIRSIRKPLIVVAATVGLVAGGFGATQASAAPSEPGMEAVSDLTPPPPGTQSLEALVYDPVLGSVVAPVVGLAAGTAFISFLSVSLGYCLSAQGGEGACWGEGVWIE